MLFKAKINLLILVDYCVIVPLCRSTPSAMETISVSICCYVSKYRIDLTLLINKQTYIHIKLILELHMHE